MLAADPEPRRFVNGIHADIGGNLGRVHVVDPLEPVPGPVQIAVAVSHKDKVPAQRALPLEGVEEVPGLLVEEPQPVVIGDLFSPPVLGSIEPHRQRGDGPRDKFHRAAQRRDVQCVGHRDHLAAQGRPQRRVQAALIEHVLSGFPDLFLCENSRFSHPTCTPQLIWAFVSRSTCTR